jgi:hypothetical protein
MKKFLTTTALLSALIYACTTTGVRTIEALEGKISKTATALERNGNYRIPEKHSGTGRGYYYILNRNGIIINHPERGLIGSDFSRFGFVNKILQTKNGCIMSETGAVSRIIVFREKGADEILCYTIPANEISGADKCEKYTE